MIGELRDTILELFAGGPEDNDEYPQSGQQSSVRVSNNVSYEYKSTF